MLSASLGGGTAVRAEEFVDDYSAGDEMLLASPVASDELVERVAEFDFWPFAGVYRSASWCSEGKNRTDRKEESSRQRKLLLDFFFFVAFGNNATQSERSFYRFGLSSVVNFRSKIHISYLCK